MMASPIAYVCQGKHCARACAHNALLRSLCKVADVRLVRCQKVCEGTVVATELNGKLQWFERVDSPKICVAMKKLVATGSKRHLGPLKKRWLQDRAGRAPR
jgi:hypothetical protein